MRSSRSPLSFFFFAVLVLQACQPCASAVASVTAAMATAEAPSCATNDASSIESSVIGKLDHHDGQSFSHQNVVLSMTKSTFPLPLTAEPIPSTTLDVVGDLTGAATTTSSNNSAFLHNSTADDQLIEDLHRWVLDNGGRISESIAMRRTDPDDPHSTRGMFATADIKQGETILEIPFDLILYPNDDSMRGINRPHIDVAESDEHKHRNEDEDRHASSDSSADSDDIINTGGKRDRINEKSDGADDNDDGYDNGDESFDEEDDYDNCDAYWLLYSQFRAYQKDPSSVSPYARYLMQQEQFYLPTLWTPAGKELLIDILGEDLPPVDSVSAGVIDELTDTCNIAAMAKSPDRALREDDFDQDLFLHAYMIVTCRGDEEILVPIYDMMNHRNGHHYNTHMDMEYGKVFTITANQDIARGQQIYNSYNHCNRCGNRANTFGTAEIFRSYGFVEHYPRRIIVEDTDYLYDEDTSDDTIDDEDLENGKVMDQEDGDEDTDEPEEEGGDISDDYDGDDDGDGDGDGDGDDDNNIAIFLFEDEYNDDEENLPHIQYRFKFDVDRNPITDQLEVTFLSPLNQGSIDFMKDELQSLQQHAGMKTSEEQHRRGVPQMEWDNAWALHDAYVDAFALALEHAKGEQLSDIILLLDDDWDSVDWEDEGEDYYRRYQEYLEKSQQD